MEVHLPNLEWTRQTTTFDYLKSKTKGFPTKMSMVAWLKLIGVVPLTAEWRRGNRLPNTNLNPDFLPAGYLAEFAYDWDKDGRTTPAEFLDALAFEVQGTKQKAVVNEVLAELSVEGLAWQNSSSGSSQE